jgi:nucleoside-diphosphate-sugar epimerase
MSTEDTMQAYWLAATKGKIGEIYNVGGKIKISIKDFLNKMISKSNTKIKTKEKKSLLRPVDIDVQVAKSDKFIRKTGWKENKNIDYSIQDLLNKMREKY